MSRDDLIARLEAATELDRELDAEIGRFAVARFLGYVPDRPQHGCALYTASIDAALTLVPEGWRLAALCERDPWFCRLETHDFESVTWGKGSDWITEVTSGSEATAKASTPALAICIAALRAREVVL